MVYLCYGEKRVKMNYVGCGNHSGNPTLALNISDVHFNSVNEIELELKNYSGELFLER